MDNDLENVFINVLAYTLYAQHCSRHRVRFHWAVDACVASNSNRNFSDDQSRWYTILWQFHSLCSGSGFVFGSIEDCRDWCGFVWFLGTNRTFPSIDCWRLYSYGWYWLPSGSRKDWNINEIYCYDFLPLPYAVFNGISNDKNNLFMIKFSLTKSKICMFMKKSCSYFVLNLDIYLVQKS